MWPGRLFALAVLAGGIARAEATAPVAQPPRAAPAASPKPPPPFRLFRYEEDYSYLADPAARTQPLDGLKYIALADDNAAVLTLGGESRSRYEYNSAPAFGLRGDGHDDFYLQRFALHADLHGGDREGLHARAFVQLLSGLVTGAEFPKPGNQDNALDLQQAFGEFILGDNRAPAVHAGDSSLAVRVGRQEMGFGSFRLVTTREPTNSRLTFDGVRATLQADRMTFDAFLVRPVEHKVGLFNDSPDQRTAFWGLYASLPIQPDRTLGLDLYYLGLDRDQARYESGVGHEIRHSAGVRVWGRAFGWDHDSEAVVQFGSFNRPEATEDILAWTVASNTGYTFDAVAWKPRVGVKLNVASGDADPADGTLGTFNPLFPRNNYFSDANLLAPYNFFNVHPSIAVRPLDSVLVTVAWDAFFRASASDAVFSPVGIVIPAGASDGRAVGSTLSLVAEWSINRHLSLTTSYAHFFRGEVVRDAGGEDVDYLGLWLTARF